MHAISSYRGNRHRPPARPLHTNRQDRLQYTVPQLASAQCNNVMVMSSLGNTVLEVMVHFISYFFQLLAVSVLLVPKITMIYICSVVYCWPIRTLSCICGGKAATEQRSLLILTAWRQEGSGDQRQGLSVVRGQARPRALHGTGVGVTTPPLPRGDRRPSI